MLLLACCLGSAPAACRLLAACQLQRGGQDDAKSKQINFIYRGIYLKSRCRVTRWDSYITCTRRVSQSPPPSQSLALVAPQYAMLRRSVVALAKPAVQQTGRTIVRDPRKQRAAAKAVVNQPPPPPPAPKLTDAGPLPNLNQNQQPMGLGSYVLAGAGVALGFAFVGALFGG